MYPNPVENSLVINTPTFIQNNEVLKIFDTTGKIVKEIRLTSQKEIINVGTLSSGLYIAQFRNSSQKFVKK